MLAILLALPQVAMAVDCGYDREKMLAMDFKSFDQTGDGWRSLPDGCERQMADLVSAYRERNKGHLTWELGALYLHEGQVNAIAGDYKSAILSLTPLTNEHLDDMPTVGSPPEMRAYVRATIAFLKRDSQALMDARTDLKLAPKPGGMETASWPPNLDIVDGLIACFGKSYKEAYAVPDCIEAGKKTMAGADAQMALAAEPHLSPRAAALIARVHAAFVKVEAEQAGLAQATNDRERLERLLAVDQAGREAFSAIDLTILPEQERQEALAAIWKEINAVDLADQEELKRMLPKEGWFRKSVYGDKACQAAFLVVQHAVNDPAFMRETLHNIELLVKEGEADGKQYAYLYDRISLFFDHKPQRYGTQLQCQSGKWAPIELEDPEHLDVLRASVGLPPESENLERFEKQTCS